MSKIFYFDVETTGLNPQKNAIIQLAYIYEKDGEVLDEGNFRIRPWPGAEIDAKALAINGITIDTLWTYPEPEEVWGELLTKFKSWCGAGGREKMIPAGYNTSFDLGFLKELFKRNRSTWYNTYFSYKALDPYPIVFLLDQFHGWGLRNHKLATAAGYFGIEIQAHDALSDIRATRSLMELFRKRLVLSEEKVGE